MNSIERLPRHQWLDELLTDPQLAVADLLSGRADKYPYARLRDAEFLHQVLPHRQGHEREYAALETALVDWLEARRRENWVARSKRGLPAYVAALIEAFSAIQMLGLKQAACRLSEQHNAYQRWLEPLRMGTATDPALELWRCHALLPQDDRYLPHWKRFCVEADTVRPLTYLTVALQGVRELPTEQARINMRYALRALAERYLARQALSEAKKELKQYCATLRFTYLRNPNDWRRVWDEVLEDMPSDRANTVRDALDGKTENKISKSKPEKPRKHIDPSRFAKESKALVNSLRSSTPVATLWPRIEDLFNNALTYCLQSGDSYSFVHSLCNIGEKVLERSPDEQTTARALLRWLPDALQWEHNNPHIWMLWAHSLDSLGQWDYAEYVYWEMRRYFPDNAHSRVELARLLMRQGRDVEAEALLREAADWNPDNAPSRVELARLLMAKGKKHFPEAERWLRQAADWNPNHTASRVVLAHLLIAKGRNHFSDAKELLRRVIQLNPNKASTYVVLAHLLVEEGEAHFPDAEVLLREAIKRDPDSESSHAELERLLELRGDKPAAITLPLGATTQRSEHPAVEFTETILPSLRADKDIAMPQLEWEVDETDSTAPQPNRAAPEETLPAKPDAVTQADALAARAAFQMTLADPKALVSGRDELLQALDDDPDNLLAAFYLDWAQALPAGKASPDAYALAASDAYRCGDDDVWKEMIKHFPEQRHIIWSLRWLASLHGGKFQEKEDWLHLEKFVEQASRSTVRVPGSDVVVQLVKNWGWTGKGRPATVAIDTRAQELIALTINNNVDPIAAAHKTNRGIHASIQ